MVEQFPVFRPGPGLARHQWLTAVIARWMDGDSRQSPELRVHLDGCQAAAAPAHHRLLAWQQAVRQERDDDARLYPAFVRVVDRSYRYALRLFVERLLDLGVLDAECQQTGRAIDCPNSCAQIGCLRVAEL